VEADEPGVGWDISGETHARTAEDVAAGARQSATSGVGSVSGGRKLHSSELRSLGLFLERQ
jgi:hypothetical protein